MTSYKEIKKNNVSENFFIKFYSKGYNDMTALYLSSEFKHYIIENGYTYVQTEVIRGLNALVLRLNKDKKGVCLLNRRGHYKDTIASTELYRKLSEKIPNIELSTVYNAIQIDEFSFVMWMDRKSNYNEKELEA